MKDRINSRFDKPHLYLFFFGGALLLISRIFLSGYTGYLLSTIGASVFISTLVLNVYKERFSEKERMPVIAGKRGLVIGGFIAGVFMIPVDLFLYLGNQYGAMGIMISVIVRVVVGSIIGFLIGRYQK